MNIPDCFFILSNITFMIFMIIISLSINIFQLLVKHTHLHTVPRKSIIVSSLRSHSTFNPFRECISSLKTGSWQGGERERLQLPLLCYTFTGQHLLEDLAISR